MGGTISATGWRLPPHSQAPSPRPPLPSPELPYFPCPNPCAALPRTSLLFAMTQHASFKSNASTGAKRNVLKRFERVELLKKRGDFKGKRVTGLRKTKPDA